MRKPSRAISHTAHSLKPTNPKDMIGGDKLPLHLWPTTASVVGCLALLDGALKYGRSNFRAVGVRFSIYYDALMRHVMALGEGEDVDPESGLPHESHALACLAIIVDARAAGKLTDDRMYPGGYRKLVNEMTQHVKRLKELRAGLTPKHYTITDGGEDGRSIGQVQRAARKAIRTGRSRRSATRKAVSRGRGTLAGSVQEGRRKTRPHKGGSRD